MKKGILLALAMLLCASPAFATTYHVRSGPGRDTYDGLALSTAWATIGKANRTALPGDVIYVYPPGTGGSPYDTYPNPDSSGSNPTGDGRITYIAASLTGVDPITTPSERIKIVLTQNIWTKPYVTMKGFFISGVLELGETADRDSVAYCSFVDELRINGADYSNVTHCIFGWFNSAARVRIGYNSVTGNHCVSDTVDHCTFNGLGSGISGDVASIVQFGRSVEVKVDSLLYRGNRHTITLAANVGDTHPRIMFNTRNSLFYRNYWRVTINNPNIYQYSIRMRDSTYRNVIRRDTIITSGPGKTSFLLATSGSASYAGQHTTFENTIDSCYWNGSAASTAYASFSDGTFNNTLSWSTLVMRAPEALRILYARGKNTLRNNTIVNFAGYAVNYRGDGASAFGGNDSAVVQYGNIFASYSQPQVLQPLPPDQYGVTDGAVVWNTADIDSGLATTQKKAQARVISNNNLYAYYGSVAAVGDRSMLAYRSGAGSWKRNAPGDSGATVYSHLENTYRMDSLSVYGSPQFGEGGPDSMATIAFNPAIGVRSAARGVGLGGQDAGAIIYPGIPEIRLDPDFIVFTKDIFTSSSFEIINDGTTTLTVSSITASGSGGVTVSPATASVAAGATQIVTVTYASGTTGSVITILSDDPNRPSVTLAASVVAGGHGGTIED